MDNKTKNILMFVAGYLLAKFLVKPTATTTQKIITIANNSKGQQSNGDSYKTTIYSSTPLKANVIAQPNNHSYNVNINAVYADDFISGINLPTIF